MFLLISSWQEDPTSSHLKEQASPGDEEATRELPLDEVNYGTNEKDEEEVQQRS